MLCRHIGETGVQGPTGDGAIGPSGENGENGYNGVCWDNVKPEIEGYTYNSTMYIGGYNITIFPNGSHLVTDLEFGLMTMYGSLIQHPFPSHNQFFFAPFHPFSGSATFTAFVSDTCQHDFLTFTIDFPVVIDIDGNVYQHVTINGQVWMGENLRTTHYNSGFAIPNVTNGTEWSNLTSGAYCNYGNSDINGSIYGRLYNWYAVNTAILCPIGWHVPSDTEWTMLIDYLGGESVAGYKLKETGTLEAGTGLWKNPNTGATNESGFSALPGGYRSDNGLFYGIGNVVYWWSATNSDEVTAWDRYVENTYLQIVRNNDPIKIGMSVRCVKD